jgi:ribosome-binding factor A
LQLRVAGFERSAQRVGKQVNGKLSMRNRAPAARSGKAPSQRQLRVGEELRHALAEMVAQVEFRDPDLAGQPITVTEVKVSPDLRNATVFVTPLVGEAATIVPALQRASSYMRGRLAGAVNLRHTPSLKFEHDSSFDQAERIGAVFQKPDIERDLAEDGDGSGT